MIQYLVLEWNGLKWAVSNSPHALVPAGPYSSPESARANIEKYIAQEDGDPNDVCVMPVEWPTEPPAGFAGVKQFGA